MKVISTSHFKRQSQQNLTQEQVDSFVAQVKEQLGLQAFEVYLSGDSLRLMSLIVPKANRKRGIGSQAMQMLNQFADQHGLRITLTPGVKDGYHGTTSYNRLVRFYRNNGYIQNKGRNKDYSLSDGMYRNPS